MKQRPEFFSNFGLPDNQIIYFIYKNCTNGLVLRECKHIKNIFEDAYFTKNSFHITLMNIPH